LEPESFLLCGGSKGKSGLVNDLRLDLGCLFAFPISQVVSRAMGGRLVRRINLVTASKINLFGKSGRHG
jgi:hypothetical protein